MTDRAASILGEIRQRRPLALGCLLVLVIAAVVRLGAAMNDLWLDEIWSLKLADTAASPFGVFTRIHHDNNHHLNTLYLYLVGRGHGSLVYRMPAIVAGVGTVVLAGLIGRRRSAVAALAAMILVGFSYPIVLYSSEARGYSLVLFFSLFFYHLLTRYLAAPRRKIAVALSLAGILGLASNATFVTFLFAAGGWSVFHYWQHRYRLPRALGELGACYAAPAVFLVALYFIDLRHVTIGGGTTGGLAGVCQQAVAWTMGLPQAQVTACVLATILFLAGIGLLVRERSSSFIFFIGAVPVIPFTFVFVMCPSFAFVRYFIVAILFLELLGSFVLAALFERGRGGQAAGALLLAGYVLANSGSLTELLQQGRGQYQDFIQYMAKASQHQTITYGANYEFRVTLEFDYYAPIVLGDRPWKFYPILSWPVGGPEWVVCAQGADDTSTPASSFTNGIGTKQEFDLVRVGKSAPLSGIAWVLYHNRNP